MLAKIGNSITLGFCGLFLGAFLGFFLSGSFYFFKYFTFYAVLVFGSVLVFKFLRRTDEKIGYRLRGAFFSGSFMSIFLCGFPGFLLLTTGEDVFISDIDMIVIAVIFLFSTFVIAIYVPINSVWGESKFGMWVSQNIRGAKVLLGLKN